MKPVVLAAAAHPDDIEFTMAGTLLRLAESGAALHMWNLANGGCGSATLPKTSIARLRRQEARAAARIAGARLHRPLVNDLAIFYEPRLLARVAAVVRMIQPDIVLAPSPHDYMEDHQNTGRLIVTALFARGMKNFRTQPRVRAYDKDVVVYHAQPHGLRDGLRRLVRPGQYVDVAPVMARKRRMLAQHKSQKEWLDRSQGMDAYLKEMESMSRAVGGMSGKFEFAEGWRRHSHLGLGRAGDDPLSRLLGAACRVDKKYERALDSEG